jgi:HEAT repeat protein
VPGLVGRLFDLDFGVRGAALEALAGYTARDIDDALEPVRRALRQGGDPHRTRAAAHALGELRDVRAVLELIDLVDRNDPAATEAMRALVAITKQDFGTKAKKWRAWYTAERGKHRIQWMIDGLGHADEAVRRSASDELKRLTGEHFGFLPEAGKRDREEARARWQSTGRSQFS